MNRDFFNTYNKNMRNLIGIVKIEFSQLSRILFSISYKYFSVD